MSIGDFNREDVTTWGRFRLPVLIAHDVGRSRDRSTAVVGGNCPIGPPLLGITEFEELPQGLYGTERASALATVDRRHDNNALIIPDLSNDPTYGETLFHTFGARVIGLHITRHGDGMNCEWRRVNGGAIPVYTVGRSHLIELLLSRLEAGLIKMLDCPQSLRAYAQLEALQTELRDTGMVYKCAAGQHDDLGMSCAMLAWAARHPHLEAWTRNVADTRRPRRRPPSISPLAWT